MAGHLVARSSRSVVGLALLTSALCGFVSQAQAAGPAPANAVFKVVNGIYSAKVDNGWVIYQSKAGQPAMTFFDANAGGSFTKKGTAKLKTAGAGLAGAGLFFESGGVVFAPCPVKGGAVKCAAQNIGPAGIGLGFGQATVGGAGGAEGGWVSDTTVKAHLTNPDGSTGLIAAVATDAANGTFAVGWDGDSGSNHAIVLTLNSANQSYVPTATTDLGTLGGATSQALGISRNAQYITGIADDATQNAHAVYAINGATSWTNISTGFPADVIKSRALAASNNGLIAGSATVKRTVAGSTKSVDIGFVYDTNSATVKFFEAPGANVIPLKVLDSGQVVGNLEFLGTGIKANHPFVYDGTNMTDFGTMVLASTGQPAFGCRVNGANNLGEVAGSCIPDGNTAYGASGTAFYLNAAGGSPVFVNVNTAIHATSNASNPVVKPYVLGTVSSIDDQHQITVIGTKLIAGVPNQSEFLASQVTYNQ